ncbi:ABC transporter permease [Streptosporangium lutulentum]|uniref:Peptide/nickel transport system permease protein n=1 Tax=Streptosporangium lutulentum TaxID=1461250 RepID=A0ABT9Q6R5_9ACTN|nr:ABC transporter permease [Streptosporangium lutulentum]MDP9842423.1 peptide/nickel transport system permease protein [Streptosporangium lutulentum]
MTARGATTTRLAGHPTAVAIAKRIGVRLIAGVGVLWGAATLSFIALHVTAGDAALSTVAGQGANPTKELLDQVRRDLGLDQPLYHQYLDYIGRLLHGDLGQSYQQRIEVSQAITEQLGQTVQLAVSAAVVAVLLAITVAVLTARRRPWRSIASGVELTLSSTPTFVIGIVLLIIFSFTLKVFPVSGNDGPRALVLPTLTLALPIGAVLAQVLRSELEEVLEQPFILTARSRGMRDTAVRVRHALRHALVQIVTMSGFVVGGLLGGAVITETLFVRQGVGQLMLSAVTTKDIPMVLGLVVFAAFVYVVVNLLVDIAYTLIDPRLVTR